MDSPFFSSPYWNQPSQRRYSNPVHRTATPSPKVVSIPVQFVSSNTETTRSRSAVKIQKAFRGFLVRKSVKKIASIKKEVEEIERKISLEETVNQIRTEAKERLRINEMLMALLFKLDSIRGFDVGVRDLRKSVTRKAIILQERVDSLVANDEGSSDRIEEVLQNGGVDGGTTNLEQTVEANEEDDIGNSGKANEDAKVIEEDGDCDVKEIIGDSVVPPESSTPCPLVDNYCSELSSMGQMGGEYENCLEPEPEDDDEQRIAGEEKSGFASTGERIGGGGGDNKKEAGEIVERLMEDNQKMMKMMNDLIARNEIQTQMLTSLTHRVGQLEKAFLCDQLRKSKKKRNT